MIPILLDTCAVIWTFQGQNLARSAAEALAESAAAGRTTYVSAFTAWEFGTLSARGRLPVPLSPGRLFDAILSVPLIGLAQVTPMVLLASTCLPGVPPRDPADRIIIATAREMGYRVVTRDRRILDYADKGHVMALAC